MDDAVFYAPDAEVAHGLGLTGEPRIHRQKARREIVQIVSAAERLPGQHEQGLQKFFGCLLYMIRAGPRTGETGGGYRDIDVFLDECQPSPGLKAVFGLDRAVRTAHTRRSRRFPPRKPGSRRFSPGGDKRRP